MAESVIVRSYRRVFSVDRRIYRVDRWPLPVPGGVPLRGVVYFVAALGAVLLAGALPALQEVVGQLSAPLRLVVVPLGVAVLATQAAPDGRRADRFAVDWLRFRLRRRRRSAKRPVALEDEPLPWDGALPTIWDEHAPALQLARIAGAARVTFARPVAIGSRRGRLVVRRRAEGRSGDAVVLMGGEVLEVRR